MWAKIKEFYANNQLLVIGIVFLIVALVFGWLLRTNHKTIDNTDTAVRGIKTEAERAGTEINTAQNQLDNVRHELDRSSETISESRNIITRSQERNRESQKLVDECITLNREAQKLCEPVRNSSQKGKSSTQKGAVAK